MSHSVNIEIMKSEININTMIDIPQKTTYDITIINWFKMKFIIK